jgi:Fe-S-cluster containining protein
MSHLIEPDKLKELANSHYKEHQDLVKKLRKKKPGNLDDIVHELDSEIFEDIDCLECGNCCRSLGPRITDVDISRLSKQLKMKDSEVVAKYLRVDEDGDYVFANIPCPFLMKDNFCMVYQKRPKACRDYPHTHQVRFQKHLKISLLNTYTCPVVFHIFRRLVSTYLHP